MLYLKARELRPGDILLPDNEEVLAVYDDDDGVWLETANSEGYVSPNQEFQIDPVR